MTYQSRPRPPSLVDALSEAAHHFRHEAFAYRSHTGKHNERIGAMETSMRSAVAVTMDHYAKLIEKHIRDLEAEAIDAKRAA